MIDTEWRFTLLQGGIQHETTAEWRNGAMGAILIEIPPKCIDEEAWNLITIIFEDLLSFSQSDSLLNSCSMQALSILPKFNLSLRVRFEFVGFLRNAFNCM